MSEPAAQLPVGVGLQVLMDTTMASLLANLADTIGGLPGRAVLIPGATVTVDGCCPTVDGDLAGQAHVRLSRLYPTIRFPQADTTYTKVPKGMAAELEIGVYRCVAGLDNNGNPPTADEVTADAVRALDDVAALQRTALETFARVPVVLGVASTSGPSGYCAGSTLLFTVAFNPACPPTAEVEEEEEEP